MSAANAKTSEPSMEEILASIRRIIADDQNAKSAETAPPAPPVAEPRVAEEASVEPGPAALSDDIFGDDVLDLTEAAVAPMDEPAAPSVDDVMFQEVASAPEPEPAPEPVSLPEPEPEPVAFTPQPEPEPVAAPAPRAEAKPAFSLDEEIGRAVEERLLSPRTDSAVSSAFTSLANTILSNNARTLEDLVGDMLRPMLKVWLDDNLPTIVERLVRAEIERVARGGR